MCTGPSDVWNSPSVLVVDAGADEVGGHEVRRELDALEVAADRLGHGLDGHASWPSRARPRPARGPGPAGRRSVARAACPGRRAASSPGRRRAPSAPSLGRHGHASSMVLLAVGHCCGAPAAPPAVAIGTAKPRPTKNFSLRRIGQRRDDPDDLPGTVQQWPARVAGVDCGVELDEAFQRPPAAIGTVRSKSGHHAGGERIGESERVPGGVHVVTDLHTTAQHRGHDDAGQLRPASARRCRCRALRRRSCAATACRRRTSPRSWLAPSTTCLAVRIWPLASMMTPAPDAASSGTARAAAALMNTTDGWIAWNTVSPRRRHVQRGVDPIGDLGADGAADLLWREGRRSIVGSNERRTPTTRPPRRHPPAPATILGETSADARDPVAPRLFWPAFHPDSSKTRTSGCYCGGPIPSPRPPTTARLVAPTDIRPAETRALELHIRVVVNEFMSLDGVVQAPGGPEEDLDGGFAHGG